MSRARGSLALGQVPEHASHSVFGPQSLFMSSCLLGPLVASIFPGPSSEHTMNTGSARLKVQVSCLGLTGIFCAGKARLSRLPFVEVPLRYRVVKHRSLDPLPNSCSNYVSERESRGLQDLDEKEQVFTNERTFHPELGVLRVPRRRASELFDLRAWMLQQTPQGLGFSRISQPEQLV